MEKEEEEEEEEEEEGMHPWPYNPKWQVRTFTRFQAAWL
jgi:hypothetical protein